MHLSAAEIARRAGGEVVAGDPAVVATSWSFDSRSLRPGACFAAVRGHRDGHDFVADAFRAGAHVALVARPVTAPGTIVRVSDTVAALQDLARSLRRDHPRLRVVGIAGSTGKTSTKDLLASALRTRAVHANPESYNNEIGLPLTILHTPPGAEVVVTEMGERAPGDVAVLCDIARPEVGLVTNVGLAHVEHLGGPDGVVEVLAELLRALPAGGLAVLNADDPRTPALRRRTRAASVTVGRTDAAERRIEHLHVDGSLRATFELEGTRFEVPLRGAHQVQNAAMAAVVAHELGVTWGDAAAGIRDAQPARWRMEVLERADGLVVLNDAYNANPDSMAVALEALAHHRCAGRRIAVLGDMRELGALGPREHAAVGRTAAALGLDGVVGVGEGGAMIAAAARGAGSVHTVATTDDAVRLVRELAAPGDVVLVKASRALGLQVVADALLEPVVAP